MSVIKDMFIVMWYSSKITTGQLNILLGRWGLCGGYSKLFFYISLISWYSMINTNIKMTKKRSSSWSNNCVMGNNMGWDPVYSVKASDSMKVLILTQSFLYCKELRQVLWVGGSKVLLSIMGVFFLVKLYQDFYTAKSWDRCCEWVVAKGRAIYCLNIYIWCSKRCQYIGCFFVTLL